MDGAPRIALLTWGSHGDVVPFVALGQALRDAGYDVVLAAQPMHAGFVRGHGLAYAPVGSDLASARYQQLMDTLVDEPNPRKQMQMLLRDTLLPDLERQYNDSLRAVAGARLVVAHWMQLAALMAAETAGLPCVTVTLNPAAVACQERPGGAGVGRNIGRELADHLWGDAVGRFRAGAGLAAIDSVTAYQYRGALSLVAVSRHLLPAPLDGHQVTGFWPLREERGWTPPDGLRDFLDAGEAPLVISFGSMGGRADETRELLLEAIRLSGRRAVVQGGWARWNVRSGPPTLYHLDYAPHGYLFARAACVVHHGGAGTTAAALRAGVPSVVVWHLLDQPYWGNVLAQAHLGPRPLQRLGLTAGALADAIGAALADHGYRARCAAMAALLAGEDGVAQALTAIEACLRAHPPARHGAGLAA
ncbi:hypothetical protein RugamoR64_50080 [Duganella rhizosphaerae]|uniref:glycosyltransferase n=1 Tax=Duganella rhizosphaerae TaxID=2885763 RepID=UPI0030E90D81